MSGNDAKDFSHVFKRSTRRQPPIHIDLLAWFIAFKMMLNSNQRHRLDQDSGGIQIRASLVSMAKRSRAVVYYECAEVGL